LITILKSKFEFIANILVARIIKKGIIKKVCPKLNVNFILLDTKKNIVKIVVKMTNKVEIFSLNKGKINKRPIKNLRQTTILFFI
jgi:hypothetical protein